MTELENELRRRLDAFTHPSFDRDSVSALLDTIASLREEVQRLRGALIAAGRNVGAGLADDVSTGFLMGVPEEARLVVERLTRERLVAAEGRDWHISNAAEWMSRAEAAEAKATRLREALQAVRRHLTVILEYGDKSIAIKHIDAALETPHDPS